jgi:HK97 family phage portal protein
MRWPWQPREPETLARSDFGPTSISPLLDAWYTVLGAEHVPTSRLTERVGAANRCLRLTAQAISTLPLRHRGTWRPAWVAEPDPVNFPNGIGDAVYAAVWSMYSRGDAFLWVTSRYEDSGYPRTWTVLDPDPVKVGRRNGRRTYRTGNLDLDPDDVLQISLTPTGGLYGHSALSAYATHLTSAAATAESPSRIPYVALKSHTKIPSPEAAEALQTQWVNRTHGGNPQVPAVLPPDIDLERIGFSPRDLMLLELREFDTRQIAAAFGVPAHKLNVPLEGGLTYQNPAMLNDQWWRDELQPSAVRIERALSTRWLPRGSWVEFDPMILLRPDLPELAKLWTELVKEGVVDVDEVRAAVLDLGPRANAPALEEIDEPAGAAAPAGPGPSPNPEVNGDRVS